jgi:hypothetical protein
MGKAYRIRHNTVLTLEVVAAFYTSILESMKMERSRRKGARRFASRLNGAVSAGKSRRLGKGGELMI